MESRIYELADELLKEMLKDPRKEYRKEDVRALIDCTDEEFTYVYAVLRSRKYADFPKDKDDNYIPGWDFLLLSNLGGDFIISGGFNKEMEHEKLMIENIKAGINVSKITELASKSQKNMSIAMLIVAILTLSAFVIQILVSIGVFEKCNN